MLVGMSRAITVRICLLALLAGLGAPGTPVAAVEKGAPAPEIALKDLAGRAVSIAALRGKVFAFQLAQGLRPDGIAGPTTFMHLNRALGVAEPRLLPAAPER